jgi:hypothetical protein
VQQNSEFFLTDFPNINPQLDVSANNLVSEKIDAMCQKFEFRELLPEEREAFILHSALSAGEMRIYSSEKFNQSIQSLPEYDSLSNTILWSFALQDQKLYFTSEIEIGSPGIQDNEPG